MRSVYCVVACVFLLSALTFPAVSSAHTFVGNGGNGVEVDGKLYLYDLVRFGTHMAPYIGNGEIEELADLTENTRFLFPREKLLRKLAALNRACPGIGDYLLGAIKSYNWVLVDFPLTPLEMPPDGISLPPGAVVFQIANRFESVIRIHRSSWDRLDDENRVALVVHEAVFSLLRVFREKNGEYQDGVQAKEVTGLLFLESFLTKPSALIYDRLVKSMYLPQKMLSSSLIRATPSLSISVKATGAKSLSFERRFFGGELFNNTSAWVEMCCDRIAAIRARLHYADLKVKTTWRYRPVLVTTKYYSPEFSSAEKFQTAVKFDLALNQSGIQIFGFRSIEDCRGLLTASFEDAAEGAFW